MTVKIYVGTYAKYNSGSIDGKWFDLSDYSHKKDFIQACFDFHSDEQDAELMFQDFECEIDIRGFGMMHESYVSKEIWDSGLLELSDQEIEVLNDYLECVGMSNKIDEEFIQAAQENSLGKYKSLAAWGEEQFLERFKIDDSILYYVDFERYAKDLLKQDYAMSESGRVFMT